MTLEERIMQKKAEFLLDPGTVIQGKWNSGTYTIIREIGRGMIGTVYLCKKNGQLAALKLSAMPMALTREVAVLKQFNQYRDQFLGPFLFDVDDWERQPGVVHAFYVMEYIDGVSMTTSMKQHGVKWLGSLLVQMLTSLENLHAKGMVFGDLKNDNILVTEHPPTIRFVDVGGVTKMGHSVKEYSNFFDRAYWQQGTRKAEARYDLFAAVMVMLAIYYPKQFPRTKNPKNQLYHRLTSIPALNLYQDILKKAINGHYVSAKEMKSAIIHAQKKDRMKRNQTDSILPQALIISLLASSSYLIAIYFF
jgi:serine/threonine-protein kinase